jgi:transposase
MTSPKLIIGIDISADSFTWTPHTVSTAIYDSATTFRNGPEGFESLAEWVVQHGYTPQETLLCLENTGVYNHILCHWMAARGFVLSVEPPQKVKRAFFETFQKTDELDSRQIAEYAVRYLDRLNLWTPPHEIIEHLQALLSTREQLSKQSVMNTNMLQMLRRKHVRTATAEKSLELTLTHLKVQIQQIDREINDRIKGDSTFGPLHTLLISIPGVGTLLAANMILMTGGFQKGANPRQLAAHLGIAPHPRKSGSSINKKPRSRRFGPTRVRKLLYLAALSLRTHQENFRKYFLRKVEAGKNKRLVLNNIANKLIRLICAVVNSRTAFIDDFKSVNPVALKNA